MVYGTNSQWYEKSRHRYDNAVTSLPLSQTSHPQFLEAGKTLCASPL